MISSPPSSPLPAAALASTAYARPSDWTSRPVSACLPQLTALFHLSRELVLIQAGWLAGVPYWDAKQAIARHVLEDAYATEAILERLHELKATTAEHKQVADLEEWIADLAGGDDGDAWLRTLYGVLKPWFIARIEDYLAGSDPVMDEPSRSVLERVIETQRAHCSWFVCFRPRFSAWETAHSDRRLEEVRSRLAGANLVEGRLVLTGGAARGVDWPRFSGIAAVRRDRTFLTPDKHSYPREGTTFAEKRFLVFWNHVQEMQFAESLATILHETREMPWAFHLDLARHMADEVRHAAMGQTRLEQLGVALTEVPMLTHNYAFRGNLDPLERFCLMTFVMEASSFERKRANVELFEAEGDEVSALYESYDIKDEMLHVNFGHLWVPVLLRVYHDARTIAELTEHCRAQIAQVITEYPAAAANMLKR